LLAEELKNKSARCSSNELLAGFCSFLNCEVFLFLVLRFVCFAAGLRVVTGNGTGNKLHQAHIPLLALATQLQTAIGPPCF
jgi:hypothetical protein